MLGLESCAHDMKKKKKKYPTHICLCMYSSTSLRIMTIKMCLTHPRHCLVTLNQTSVFHSLLLPSNKHFPLSNHKAVLQWNMGTENKNRWWRETSEAPEMKKKMLQIRTDRSLQGLPRTKSVHEWKVLWMQRGEKLWIGIVFRESFFSSIVPRKSDGKGRCITFHASECVFYWQPQYITVDTQQD